MNIPFLILFAGLMTSLPLQALIPGGGKESKNDGLAIVIAFPDKNIPLPTDPTIWNKLARFFDFDRDDHWKVGHAGLLLIDKKSGLAKYVDFGRYDHRIDIEEDRPDNYGVVRTPETVPELELDVKARFANDEIVNLDSLMASLATKSIFQSYGRIEAAVYDRLNFNRMVDFVKEVSSQGYVKYGCPTHQYCSKFARQVIRKGGGRFSLTTYTGMQMVRWNRKNL